MGKDINEGIPVIAKITVTTKQLRETTKKEWLEALKTSMVTYNKSLSEISDSEQLFSILHSLRDKITTLELPSEFEACVGFKKDLECQVETVLAYRATIDSVIEVLERFISHLDSLISEEKEKEQKKARNAFTANILRQLADQVEAGKIELNLDLSKLG